MRDDAGARAQRLRQLCHGAHFAFDGRALGREDFEWLCGCADRLAAAEAARDAALAGAAALKVALVTAAIPLEALHMTEMDGAALCPEVKEGVREAVAAVRRALAGEAPP